MLANVNMMTSEKDIDVKYGFIDFGPEREAARTSLKYIHTDMCDIKRSYFKLGFHLNEFKECKYYKDFGYSSFEEFCEHNFDLDKSAISRCINVFLMITNDGNKEYRNGVEIHGCAMDISEKYKKYSYSQLCEMLPLDDKQRSQVKPDMTIKQIRDMKNQISDISKTKLMEFFEYFKEEVSPFTREELLKVFNKKASTWSGHHGDKVSYSFKPGKVQIHFSNYYSFAKIIKYYEDCGGTFEGEIATSQLEGVLNEPEIFEHIDEIVRYDDKDIGTSEFVTSLWDCVEDILDCMVYQILNYRRSGKSFEIETMNGDTYRLLFMAGKKKEG